MQGRTGTDTAHRETRRERKHMPRRAEEETGHDRGRRSQAKGPAGLPPCWSLHALQGTPRGAFLILQHLQVSLHHCSGLSPRERAQLPCWAPRAMVGKSGVRWTVSVPKPLRATGSPATDFVFPLDSIPFKPRAAMPAGQSLQPQLDVVSDRGCLRFLRTGWGWGAGRELYQVPCPLLY